MRFTTAMHAGMDGPHRFRISVPTDHPDAPVVGYEVKALFK